MLELDGHHRLGQIGNFRDRCNRLVDNPLLARQVFRQPIVSVKAPEQRVEQGGLAEAILPVDERDVLLVGSGEKDFLSAAELAKIFYD